MISPPLPYYFPPIPPSLPLDLSLSIGAAPESSLLIKNLSPAGLHHSLAGSGLCALSKFFPFSGVRTAHTRARTHTYTQLCLVIFFTQRGHQPVLFLLFPLPLIFFAHFNSSLSPLSFFHYLRSQTSDSMLESFS